MNINNCRVCGLYIEDPPWGINNNAPSYEICPCCGVEFGNEDYNLDSLKVYRKKWIENGCKWFMPKMKPPNWDFEKQFQGVSKEFM